MKDKKEKIEKKAPLSGEDVNAAQELKEDDLDQVAGGIGNPFGNRPRAGYQPIDDDLRGNG